MHQSAPAVAKPPTPPAESACPYTPADLSKSSASTPSKYSKYNPLNYMFSDLSQDRADNHGELLADAKSRGARRVLLAIGGSATNDAGIGAAVALDWLFVDGNGRNVPPDGGHLKDVEKLLPTPPPFERVEVLCDVTNPLYGPRGAAWIYGRQKGGSDTVLAELDDGLKHLAYIVKSQLGRDVADMPGAGAAGGLGYGAVVFLGAELRRGIEVVLDIVGFDAAARNADIIITGEGHLDGQSAQGKLI